MYTPFAMKYIAYTIKGLEQVAQTELLEQNNQVKILSKSDKVVIFDFDGNPNNLLKLRTIDDINLYVCDLQELELTNLHQVIEKLQSLRPVGNSFSLTTSIVSVDKNKDELVYQIKQSLADKGLV